MKIQLTRSAIIEVPGKGSLTIPKITIFCFPTFQNISCE